MLNTPLSAWLLPVVLLTAAPAAEKALPGMTIADSPEMTVQTFRDADYTKKLARSLYALRSHLLQIFKATPSAAKFNVVVFEKTEDYVTYVKSKKVPVFSDRGGYFPDMKTVLLPAGNSDEAALRSALQHEVLHHFNRALLGTTPVWFDEGIAMYFQDVDFSQTPVKLGAASEGSIRVLKECIDEKKLSSVAQLVKLDYGAFHVKNVETERMYYDQSWALVHFMLHADQFTKASDAATKTRLSQYKSRFLSFYNEMLKTKRGPQAWDKALQGADLKQLESDYSEHIKALQAAETK